MGKKVNKPMVWMHPTGEAVHSLTYLLEMLGIRNASYKTLIHSNTRDFVERMNITHG